jgi:hypothetical protein
MELFPNLDPNNLVIFYIVATEKSLTAAAEDVVFNSAGDNLPH